MTKHFLAATVVLASCAPLRAQDSASVARQLDVQYGRFSQAYITLDAETVASIYAEDAFYMSPGSDIQRGRATIRRQFAEFFDAVRTRGDSVTIAFAIVDRRVAQGLAADVGYCTLSTKAPSGQSRSSRGKFAVIWVPAADGRWRIRTDSYSDVTRVP